jgi:ABC-type amino acid transport substrate-binding protein
MSYRFAVLSMIFYYSAFSCVQASETMTFTTLSRGSEHRDIISETIVKNAYSDLGIKVDIVVLPGLRALKDSNNGEYDGELRRSNLDKFKYPNLIKVDSIVNSIEICVYSNTKDLIINTSSDLKPYRVGFQIGGRQSTKLASYAKIQAPVNKIKQLMHMLKYNRIDLALGNCRIVSHYIMRNKTKDIYVLYPPLVSKKLYHYIHVKHKHLQQKITTAIRKSRADYLQALASHISN